MIATTRTIIARPDLASELNAGLKAGFHIDLKFIPQFGRELTVRTVDGAFNFDDAVAITLPIASYQEREFSFPQKLYRAQSPKLHNFNSMMSHVNEAYRDGKIIFVVPPFVDWNIPLFQRPQHISAALAELGAVVIYFSPCSTTDFGEEIIEIRENLILCKQTASFEKFVQEAPPTFIDVYSTNYALSLIHI